MAPMNKVRLQDMTWKEVEQKLPEGVTVVEGCAAFLEWFRGVPAKVSSP
jgi:hypothetical protein